MCNDCFSRPLLSDAVMDADISSTVHDCLSSPDPVTVMAGGSWAKAGVKRVGSLSVQNITQSNH